jgi:hypothetical protein
MALGDATPIAQVKRNSTMGPKPYPAVWIPEHPSLEKFNANLELV